MKSLKGMLLGIALMVFGCGLHFTESTDTSTFMYSVSSLGIWSALLLLGMAIVMISFFFRDDKDKDDDESGRRLP